MDDLVREVTALMQTSTNEDGKWKPPGHVRRYSREEDLIHAARTWVLPQLAEHLGDADKAISYWEARMPRNGSPESPDSSA